MTHDNRILVSQAFFGGKDRGHGLLRTTIDDEEINAFLTRVSDMPLNKPGGMSIAPFFGLHHTKEMIAFSKTFADLDAHRPGMVFTHTLVISEEDSGKLTDLNKLFEHFITEIPYKTKLLCENFFINPTSADDDGDKDKDQMAALKKIVDRFINGRSATAIALPEDVHKLIVYLWNNSKDIIRQLLTFRLSFSAADVNAHDHRIYFVPPSLISKWDQASCLDLSAEFVTEVPLSVEYLLSGSKSSDFEYFLAKIGKYPSKIEDFILYEKAFDYYKDLHVLNAIKLLQLIRLLIKIAPIKGLGKEIKAEVIEQLAVELKKKTDSDFPITSFSNIDVASLPFSEDIIMIMENRIMYWWNEKEDHCFDSLLERRLSEGNSAWWDILIDNTLKKILQERPFKNSFKLWKFF